MLTVGGGRAVGCEELVARLYCSGVPLVGVPPVGVAIVGVAPVEDHVKCREDTLRMWRRITKVRVQNLMTGSKTLFWDSLQY